jgi:glucuronate isomerase
MKPLHLHPDRLFPAEPRTRDIARALYATVADLPIISPHGTPIRHGSPITSPSPIRRTC